MKKIFYILASAIVALGAVACDNQDLDNIAPGVGGDSLSFSAVIDNTKTDLSGNATVWVEGDVVVFEGYEQYEFVYDGSANFTCTVDGVTAALGTKDGLTAWYNKDGIDSTKGTAGAQLKAEGCSFTALNPSFKFAVQNAFLKFITTEKVTLKGAGMFSTGDEVTIEGTGETQYVAINPTAAAVSFSYSVDGVQCKVLSQHFEVKNIYNLGELYGASDWEISDGTRFLKTATPDLFVAKNVKLAANNFCLKNVKLAWGAVGAKYGLVIAGTKSVDKAIGIYNADWAGDITISNASTVAHDIYFDYANSRLYVLTVGKTPAEIAAPTHATYYDLAGTMNGWSGGTKFTYSGDNVWHLVVDMAANAEFKVRKDGGWTTCYGHYAIQENVGRTLSSGSDNAKMKAAGTYEIWVIPSHSPQLYIIKR